MTTDKTSYHTERRHARHSASAAHRWAGTPDGEQGCPLAVRLSQDIPRTSSPAAEAGTEAAEIAEHCLLKDRPAPDTHPELQHYLDEIRLRKELGGYSEMHPEFNLKVEISEALLEDPDSWEVGGTPDIVLIDPKNKRLWVGDLKWGMKLVKAWENQQLRMCIMGVLQYCCNMGWGLEGWELEGTICQPRVYPGVSNWRIDQASEDFFHDSVAHYKAALRRNRDKNAKACAGDWCTFCPAGDNGKCPLQEDALLAAIPDDGIDPKVAAEEMPIERIAELFKAKKVVDGFFKHASKRLFSELEKGPSEALGLKLAASNVKSAWKKGKEVEILEAAKAKGVDMQKPGIQLRTQGEGKKELGKEFVAEWTEKPSPKPIIVPITDKRLPWQGGIDLAAIPDDNDG